MKLLDRNDSYLTKPLPLQWKMSIQPISSQEKRKGKAAHS